MRLAPGTRLGCYEVISGIGAGGMGEVYRARDTVLHRDIALKLVNADVCHRPDSMTRLRREARALAALNHPNVATLHGLAEFDGSCGIVMELVEGEVLSDVLRRRGRLNAAEGARLGVQIAAALEAAHERGITHRDLKPANIKITGDGVAKVLDFGLAKTEGGDADAAIASTLMTDGGVVLGTYPYMSPEQARGAPVDRRTDIWAFGCVLFEMLSGRQAFDGDTRSDIVVSILEKDPDWAALPADTPAAQRRIIKRCLEKDVRRRFRDIGDVRLELEDSLAVTPAAELPLANSAPARSGWVRSAAFAAAGLAVGVLSALPWRAAPATPGEARFAIALPPDEQLAPTELGGLAMAPDGRALVYVIARGNTTQLVVRPLDSSSARALQGTFGAVSPFISPDGAWIGFFANGKLKKVPFGGGSVTEICDAPDGLGGSWSSTGTIVFAAATAGGLQQVRDSGGTPSRATDLDVSRGEFSHRWPQFLPDGDTVLFTIGTVGEWGEAEIAAQSLRTGKRTSILKGGTNPRYLTSGHLAYAHDRAIWIVPFDSRRLTISGAAVRALDGVNTSVDGAAHFAGSQNGAVTYYPSVAWSARRLIIVDGTTQTPLAAPPHAYVTPRVSVDGSKVVLGVADDVEHVWAYDMSAGTLSQLTFEAANRAPIWSPDGKRIVFASNRNGALNLFALPSGADGPVERMTTSDALQIAGSWSPDGAMLAFMEQHPSTGRDIWLMRRGGERVALVNTDADESAPRFSPDGRWIAYVSNESGQPEVYVRSVTGPVTRRVSKDGGSEPVWGRDGSALYYRSYGSMFVADVKDGVVTSNRLVNTVAAEPGTFDAAGYDTMTGNRFLMITSAQPGAAASELRVVLNWVPASLSSP